jgi:hypothetical protein
LLDRGKHLLIEKPITKMKLAKKQPVVSGSQSAAALELAIEITEMTESATSELRRELGRQ